ncbi:MAG: RpiB/LacA/LacB family sugar-phosphate isomerase [Prevotellaceae bacterium]|nr:RpiB/LacA/LacB family sugar-phosphate isomerase [Prevotellaceae bacterium]
MNNILETAGGTKIGIASDHAGYNLKLYLAGKLKNAGYEVTDYGTDSDSSVDYPDFGHPLGQAIDKGEYERGIAICYSGNGIGMVLNRHKNVRAAICWNPDTAKLARAHNNANVCVLPAHFLTNKEAEEIVFLFLASSFDGGRHARRVDKINSGLQG